MGLVLQLVGLVELSPAHTFLTLLILVTTYLFVIYPFCLNPLHKIPGPLPYKISKLFILNDQRIESRNEKLLRWHQLYGPVVQISPTEVSFSRIEDVKRIYVKNNLPKSSFYKEFATYNELNAFSTMDKQQHLKRKRMMTKLYTKSAVFQASSQRHMNEIVHRLTEYISGQLECPIEVHDMFGAFAMDVVSYYELGEKHVTTCLTDLRQRKVIEAFRVSNSMWFYTTLAPSWRTWVADEETTEKADECVNWGEKVILAAYDDDECDESSLLYHLKTQGLNKYAIASEIFDHLTAGHDTTATSLSYCAWEMSRPVNQHLQDALYDEMCSHFGNRPLDVVPLEEIDRLPLLDAIIAETTRLHSAIPGSEPRVVDSPYTITLSNNDTVTLPKGTIVSSQPWTLHKDPSVFVQPDDFFPHRWLRQDNEGEEEFKKRVQTMRQSMLAFGTGNRMCLGMNVAALEMKICMAQLYWRFQSRVSPQWCKKLSDNSPLMGKTRLFGSKQEMTDVQLMSMADIYTSRPMFDECWLQFTSRQMN